MGLFSSRFESTKIIHGFHSFLKADIGIMVCSWACTEISDERLKRRQSSGLKPENAPGLAHSSSRAIESLASF